MGAFQLDGVFPRCDFLARMLLQTDPHNPYFLCDNRENQEDIENDKMTELGESIRKLFSKRKNGGSKMALYYGEIFRMFQIEADRYSLLLTFVLFHLGCIFGPDGKYVKWADDVAILSVHFRRWISHDPNVEDLGKEIHKFVENRLTNSISFKLFKKRSKNKFFKLWGRAPGL